MAAEDRHFQAAEDAFEPIHRRTHADRVDGAGDPRVGRMLTHFEARSRFDAQQWSTFDRDKLIRLRNERREFSGDQHEALYRLWKTGGSQAVDTVLTATLAPRTPSEGSFAAYGVEHTYDFFGTLRTGK